MSPMKDDHQDLAELIPWYVNGTLDEEGRARLEAHLSECSLCHADLVLERQVHREISEQTAVEYMPAASLKKLQARLDGIATAPVADSAGGPRFAPRRLLPWQGVMAASVAIMALAVSLVAADRLSPRSGRGGPAEFTTVTSNTARSPDEVIRAVFAPDITLQQLQDVLDEAQVRIVSGPTEAGVYSLAPTSTLPVPASLARLRGHASVRFAESTRVVVESGRAP